MNLKFSKQHVIQMVVIIVILVSLGVGAIVFYKSFHITDVKVEGNIHYTSDEIREMVITDRLCQNSLFLSLKYKNKSIKNIPFVERMDVSIQDNHTVLISVYEKALAGYVEYLGNYMYFDKDGIIVESSKISTPGIPQVTGLAFDYIVLYEKLPVENEEVFQKILNITKLLQKNEIMSDRIYFNTQKEMTLYFGNVRVNLGDESSLDEKMMRLKYILPSLEGMSGELHMESYSETNKNTKFEMDNNQETNPELENSTEEGELPAKN